MTAPDTPSLPLPHAAVRFWALIPCAGMGARAVPAGGGQEVPKQYRLVAQRPMVLHTLAAFASVSRLAGTLVAVAPGDQFLHAYPHASYFTAPCGGATRAATVQGGLRVLLDYGARPDDWVLVHDAARCLVTPEQIRALIDACEHDTVGGLLGYPLADTLKNVSDGLGGVRVVSTVDRNSKWLAQTPQMFRLGALQHAIAYAGVGVTDEASAIEATGQHPRLVLGSAQNFKVTYPDDFALATAVLMQRAHSGTLDRFGAGQGAAATSGPHGNPFFT